MVFVVDSAKVKENRRDEMNETPTLVECWASRAAAKQRRGRAGRGPYGRSLIVRWSSIRAPSLTCDTHNIDSSPRNRIPSVFEVS